MKTVKILRKFKEEYNLNIKVASVGIDLQNIFVYPVGTNKFDLPETFMGFNVYVGSYLPQVNSNSQERK